MTISGTYDQLESAVLKLTELLQEVIKRNPVSYSYPFENIGHHNSQHHTQAGSQTILANKSALQYHMVT